MRRRVKKLPARLEKFMPDWVEWVAYSAQVFLPGTAVFFAAALARARGMLQFTVKDVFP